MAVDSTVANTVIYLPCLPFFAWTNKDATYLYPTDPPWRWPPAHGAAATAPLALMPTWARHRGTKYLGWPGLWIGAGHMGGGTRRVWCDAPDRDEYPYRGLLPQLPGVRRDVFGGAPYSAWGSQVGVDILTRERPVRWGIESMRIHRPNVVSCDIVTGPTWTPLVGA